MPIEASRKYGQQAVSLDGLSFQKFEGVIQEFLADPQIVMARTASKYLASSHFQQSFYRAVPPALKREFFEKGSIDLGTFEEGTYGYWICLLEFLLRMTGKEIIFNPTAWDAYDEKILTLSPFHETLKFLQEGLMPKDRGANRAHCWAGEACRQEIQAHVGATSQQCKVLLVQPVALCRSGTDGE